MYMTYPRVLHYPGSKWSMAEWIVNHFPEHEVYLEPYFGSGAALFEKEPAAIETINDMDEDVVNLFRIIRERPDELARAIKWTPWARTEYYKSYEKTGDELEDARRFLVRCWQAIGARTSDRTGWRSSIKASGKNRTTSWDRLPNHILKVTERLKNVQIECQPAVQIIERYRREEVLIYADPPYLGETRKSRMYRHEMMKPEQHEEMLKALLAHPGPVLVSGYAHALYERYLKGWRRETRIAYAESGKKRIEVLWINQVAAERMMGQQTLF
ncbi:SAM-dependent methyltransferase [Aneurinibacillus danicus]|uniref:SAM-dependent methyltransferase n=2 Tax=Aneurinibacillus danicus TaxID=267746 RepID=A0A511VBB7_9BACL|nr:SAM-dependent methyltransferase [Aneurinibacillus danicus]